mgnify:CR=1 FL=1|jgi:hypothetical protein
MITSKQHLEARQIRCEICGAGVGVACKLSINMSHALRVHTVAARAKPLPTEAVCAALTQVDGKRDDAQPFVHWLDGAHDFRAMSAGNNHLTLGVFRLGEHLPVAKVRRALLDLGVAHGLLISAVESKGRGRFIASDRGRLFHEAGGDLLRFCEAIIDSARRVGAL